MVQGSNLGREKIFFLLQISPDWVCGPSNLLFNGYQDCFLGIKMPGAKLTTNLHSVLRLRMSGPIPPPPLHISKVQTGKTLPLLLLSLMGFKAQLHHPYKFSVFLLPHWV
jgi:hypothetical protein